MKARAPRQWESLSKGDKKIVCDYCLSVLQEAEDKDMRIMLELFIKMNCALIHDLFGFGEKRLNLYIGNFQMMFREQARLVSKGKQLESLDKRMKKIFRKKGFPQEFVDGIIGKVDRAVLDRDYALEKLGGGADG